MTMAPNALSWSAVKLRPQLLLLFTLFLLSTRSEAQQYFFQSFGKEEGLPVSTVNDLAEDPLGFIWIATEGGGLARFDGLHSHVYSVKDGLPSDYVTVVSMLGDSGMVVGTDRGALWYNGMDFMSPWDLPEERVVDFAHRGTELYFLFRRELVVVDVALKTTVSYAPEHGPELMSISASDQMYIGASDGLYKFNLGHFDKWWSGVNVRSIFVGDTDENGNQTVQVGARDDVYLILRRETAVRNISTTEDHSIAHPDVRDIVQDSAGRWWYGSYQNGLRRFDQSSNLLDDGVQIGSAQGLPTPKVRTLLISSDGRIWIGGLTGLSRMVEPDLYRVSSQDGLLGDKVHALHVSYDGSWWFGGLDGLTRRNQRGQVQQFQVSDGLPPGLIFDIEESDEGQLVVASESGLARQVGNRFVSFGDGTGLENAFVFDVEPTRDGNWLVATTFGMYISRGSRFELLDADLANTAFARVQVDEDGRIWAMDIEGRILKQTPSGWELPFDEKRMLNMSGATFQITDGVLWIGTNGHGLWRFDGSRLDSVNIESGLLSNNVWSLNVLANDVWIGTDVGIQRVIWDNGWGFGTRVSEARGFGSMECNMHSVVRTATSIVFGTNSGALVAPLGSRTPSAWEGEIHLTRIDLYFEQPETWVDWSAGLTLWNDIPQRLRLPYDQNYLRFSYAALGVADPRALSYSYRLSPNESGWTEAEGRSEAIFTNLQPGKYRFEVRARDPLSGRSLRSEPYAFEIRYPFWKTWWFYTAMVLLLAGIIWLYIHIRLQRIRKVLALEEEKNDLERRALRLQMNPHFVFNALDAISGYIFKNEPKEAVKYLNNFAKLMRLMLESSREQMIPIHTEVQLLKNYLSLEQLRFSGEFEAEVEVEEDLDVYGLAMPSMMIQPHVENAILHGLRPKGEGFVHVRFEMASSDTLRCTIEDNGVGRKKAEEIKERSGRKFRSLAGEISRRRIELFDETIGGKSAVIIQDLYDENGEPSGTRVVLELPAKSTDDWDVE